MESSCKAAQENTTAHRSRSRNLTYAGGPKANCRAREGLAPSSADLAKGADAAPRGLNTNEPPQKT